MNDTGEELLAKKILNAYENSFVEAELLGKPIPEAKSYIAGCKEGVKIERDRILDFLNKGNPDIDDIIVFVRGGINEL